MDLNRFGINILDKRKENIKILSDEYVNIVGGKLWVSHFNWGIAYEEAKKNDFKLDNINYEMPEDTAQTIKDLKELAKKCDEGSTESELLKRNINSAIKFLTLKQVIGTDQFTDISVNLWGKPSDASLGGHSYREIAENVLNSLKQIDNNPKKDISLPKALKYLKEKIKSEYPKQLVVNFEKRKASPSQILVSGSDVIFRDSKMTLFSQIEIDALYHHEIETHILTYENGLEQDILGFLSKASPRTNRTQEGLAIVSECLNGCAEPNRMRKIATRVIAIDDALNGADFKHIFNLFRKYGNQNEYEAYYSTQRVLRGGQPHNDGCVFTKDLAYLAGLVDIYERVQRDSFNKNDFKLLFAGKTYHKNLDVYAKLRDEDIFKNPVMLPKWFEEERFRSFESRYFDGKDLSAFIDMEKA